MNAFFNHYYILIISGNEILSGKRQDKHVSHLTHRLSSLGLQCLRCIMTGDDLEPFTQTIKDALSITDLVIVTGGLGPTVDDITRDAISAAMQIPLQENNDVVSRIKAIFRRAGRDFKDNNRLQALVPVKGGYFPNNNGTAPGLLFDDGAKIVIALPGPPRELEPMVEESVIPFLKNRITCLPVPISTSFSFCGIGESNIDHFVRNAIGAAEDLNLSYLATLGVVELTLSVPAPTDVHQLRLKKYENVIQCEFAEFIFSNSKQSLEETIGSFLTARGETLSVAESCTGGMLGSMVTSVPGASSFFKGGVLAYSNEIKSSILSVKNDTLLTHGAVSREAAMELAIGVCSLLCSDWGISVTGIAGPDGGTIDKPVGTVWVSVANRNGFVHASLLRASGNREAIRQRSCIFALDLLRRVICDLPLPD